MKTRAFPPAGFEDLVGTLLARHPWWRPLRIRPLVCATGETAWVVRRFRGAYFTVVESPLGTPFPGHRRRVAVRESLYADHDVLVFTDAGHTRFLVSGIVRTPGGGRVVEERSPTEDAALLATLFAPRGPRFRPSAARVAGRKHVIAELARAVPTRRGADAPATTPALRRAGIVERIPGMARRIRGIDDPGELRRLVRTLDRVVVVDRGGSRDSLLGAADGLEWLRRLALARMRAFLHDAPMEGVRRPERLRDFRRAVEAADEPLRRSSGPCFTRRTIAQRHIFAIAPDEHEAACVRSSVVAWVGFPPEDALAIDTGIAVDGSTGGSAEEADDRDIVMAAWRLVADDRLVRHDVEPEGWRTAAAELERRRGSDSLLPMLVGRRRLIVIEPGTDDG